ncbi:MAG: hypothetical protein WC663_06130 [Patescibacteria group bacterium]
MAEEKRDCQSISSAPGAISNPAEWMINNMLLDAVIQGATEIHVTPFRNKVEIEFMIDGHLTLVMRPQLNLHGYAIAHIKEIALLNEDMTEMPQTGVLNVLVSVQDKPDRRFHFDVTVSQTEFGEKAILILNREVNPTSFAL